MIKIFEHLKRGSGHKDFCEDYKFTQQLADRYIAAGVFDGCSSGEDSHFASALFGKVFKKKSIQVFKNKKAGDDINVLLKKIVYQSFSEIAVLQKIADIETDELLSTVVFMLADIAENNVRIISFGDGFISINKQHILIDQNNRPDYPIYHLHNLTNKNLFEETLKKVSKYIEINTIEDISIATDGIDTFTTQKQIQNNDSCFSTKEFLCNDLGFVNTSNMLARKCNILKLKHNLINWDDLAIIRLINISKNE